MLSYCFFIAAPAASQASGSWLFRIRFNTFETMSADATEGSDVDYAEPLFGSLSSPELVRRRLTKLTDLESLAYFVKSSTARSAQKYFSARSARSGTISAKASLQNRLAIMKAR